MSDIDWDRIFGTLPAASEETRRINLYREALSDMWKNKPNHETQKRLHGFMKVELLARLKWINWVEERAQLGSPAWCVELVGMAVARKIGAN